MRIRGTVKWFNETKGYGFLRRDDGQSDCFVHHSEIQSQGYRTLQEGERVEFDVVQQPKGPKAGNVVKLDEADGGDSGDSGDSPDSSDSVAAAPADDFETGATTSYSSEDESEDKSEDDSKDDSEE